MGGWVRCGCTGGGELGFGGLGGVAGVGIGNGSLGRGQLKGRWVLGERNVVLGRCSFGRRKGGGTGGARGLKDTLATLQGHVPNSSARPDSSILCTHEMRQTLGDIPLRASIGGNTMATNPTGVAAGTSFLNVRHAPYPVLQSFHILLLCQFEQGIKRLCVHFFIFAFHHVVALRILRHDE